MNYVDEFELDVDKTDSCDMLAFVGAGGKTTTMFTLAEELAALGRSVLVTTTTMIFQPNASQYNEMIFTDKDVQQPESGMRAVLQRGSIAVMGKRINDDGKLLGVDPDFLDDICRNRCYDVILVEADGSKRKSIKAPAKHEPVLPNHCGKVVGVIGMDCIGKEINSENVHRPELFCALTAGKEGDSITFEHILKLIGHFDGLFKGTVPEMDRYVLLNKLDPNTDDVQIEEMKQQIHRIDSSIRNVAVNLFDITFNNRKDDSL